MNACKKALAMLMSLCLVLTMVGFCASAENATPAFASIRITSAKAVKFKADDPQTVLQLELGIGVVSSGEEGAAIPTFDKVDTNAVITIYDGLYITASDLMSQILGKDNDGAFGEAVIATANPVSYSNGVLTVDVFSKNGQAGAKMLAVEIDGFNGSAISDFYFELPPAMLTDSDASYVNAGIRMSTDVQGLQSMTLELPSLVRRVLTDFASGNLSGLLGKMIFLLPIALIIAPILLKTVEKNAQKIYDLYEINLHGLFADANKALRAFIPYLIGSIF